jgi:hypothetical protein
VLGLIHFVSLGIPAKFRLPIVYGFQDKRILSLQYEAYPHHHGLILAIHQAITYSYTAIAAEQFMREYADAEELATLTVEKNNPADRVVQRFHDFLRGKELGREEVAHLREVGGDYLPIRKIIDCINFAAKDQAIMLQLADACAFIFRRYLEKKPDLEEFCDALTNNNPKVLEPEGGRDGTLEGYKILSFTPKREDSATLA